MLCVAKVFIFLDESGAEGRTRRDGVLSHGEGDQTCESRSGGATTAGSELANVVEEDGLL